MRKRGRPSRKEPREFSNILFTFTFFSGYCYALLQRWKSDQCISWFSRQMLILVSAVLTRLDTVQLKAIHITSLGIPQDFSYTQLFYHSQQCYCSQGWNIFKYKVRGSNGYGEKFRTFFEANGCVEFWIVFETWPRLFVGCDRSILTIVRFCVIN